jgi:hypothetical protein
MKSFSIAFRSFAALTLVASTLAAQERDGSYSLNYGNSDLGGRITFTAYAKTEMQLAPLAASVSAGANMTARVKMFGHDVEAASVDLAYKISSTTLFTRLGSRVSKIGSSTFTVKLAGFEVVNEQDPDVVGNLPALNVFGSNGLQYPIPVGPVVVTVSANAGVTSSFSLSGDLDLTNMAISATGSIQAAATGVARVGLGVPGFSVGVTGTLKFADTTASLTLATSPSGPSGSFGISVRPIRLLLGVYAEAWPFRWTQNFYDYSLPAQSRTTPLS